MQITSFLLVVFPTLATALATTTNRIVSLQAPHVELTPAQTLRQLADDCDRLGIDTFDVYGDYITSSTATSYLRQFESQVALEFQKEDAVFMPSGVMAQQIALLIHNTHRRQHDEKKYFACHPSSHLLLHEEHGYRELLGMEAVVIDTTKNTGGSSSTNVMTIPPMRFKDVEELMEQFKLNHTLTHAGELLSTLIVELPHRELGGRCTPYSDLLEIRELCTREKVLLHCDGARIFEATTGYDNETLAQLAQPFDSVYISFYKGLGGISGAMLMGSAEFCSEARIWLRRFGGNLYTLLPYAVSGWAGYKRHWLGEGGGMTFLQKKEKLARIVRQLTCDHDINSIVTFEPSVPEVNMIHGYLRLNADDFPSIKEEVERNLGIRVLNRVRSAGEGQSKFEWTMGEANGNIPDETYFKGWKALAAEMNKK